MAPELLDGRPFNKSVDVYAFGIVLYEVGMSVSDYVISHKRAKGRGIQCTTSLSYTIVRSTAPIRDENRFRGRADVLRVCFYAWGGVRS